MLKITIKSYDETNDTFACTMSETDAPAFDASLPASLLPYVAPKLVALCEDLPFDLIGKSFTLNYPAGALL